MNELTKRLFAEGWTEAHHPENVFWGDWKCFQYKWEYAITLTWITPCGLFVDGRSVGCSDTSYGGVEYTPENNNPLIRCPYNRKSCPHIPDGLRDHFALCPCHMTDEAYDAEQSVERIEREAAKRRHDQYMEITGGSYCMCVVGTNGYEGGLVQIRYDVLSCITCHCKNEFCVIRKQPRDLTPVNIFYDVRRTKISRKGFLENTTVTLEKGLKVFDKAVAKTDAEIWLKIKRAEYTPLNNRTVIDGKQTQEDRGMQYFSDWHRKWPGYDYFEFHYEVENIRIEKKESRDLLQDLQDIGNGITVTHASDLQKAAAAKKKEDRQKRREAKERKRQQRIAQAKATFDEKYGRKGKTPASPPELEQLSLF